MCLSKFSLLVLSLITLLSCNTSHQKVKQESVGNLPGQESVNDDVYVGRWLEIGGKDTVTITRIHDGEYQLGQLTGILRIEEKSGREYIYCTVQNSMEVQFIYDHTTSHLIERTPIFNKEYQKLE